MQMRRAWLDKYADGEGVVRELTMVFWASIGEQLIENMVVSFSRLLVGDTRFLQQVWKI